MTGKQRKGLIILLTPFLLGFLLGILAGRSCSRSSEEAVSGSVSAETSDEALSDDEMKEDAGLSDNSDVYEEPQVREIIYHASRPPYAKWFADLNEAHLDAAARLGLKTIPETRNDIGGVGLVKSKTTDIIRLTISNTLSHILQKVQRAAWTVSPRHLLIL